MSLDLISRFSRIASTTRSQSLKSLMLVVGRMRPSACSAACAEIFSFETMRSRLFLIVFNPRSRAAWLRSRITTGNPATAKVWATPFPIVPAPTTPICRTSDIILSRSAVPRGAPPRSSIAQATIDQTSIGFAELDGERHLAERVGRAGKTGIESADHHLEMVEETFGDFL